MKPFKLALFALLLIFHITLVILSLDFTQSFADSLVRDPSGFRYTAGIGLVLLLVAAGVVWFDRRLLLKKAERLEAEKNQIKAEIFDREKQAKAREEEVEREIQAFQATLPTAEPTDTPEPPVTPPPVDPEAASPAPPPDEPESLTDGTAPADDYGPLTPNQPDEDTDPPRS